MKNTTDSTTVLIELLLAPFIVIAWGLALCFQGARELGQKTAAEQQGRKHTPGPYEKTFAKPSRYRYPGYYCFYDHDQD